MRYRVFLHPRAREYLDALDDAVRERMKKKAEELAEHPKRGKPLKHSSFWSTRETIDDDRIFHHSKLVCWLDRCVEITDIECLGLIHESRWAICD